MNLQSLPWWGRLLLFVGLGAAIIYLGFKIWPNFGETKKRIAAQEEELASLQAEIQRGRSALKRKPELEAQIAIKEAELALLKRILPTEPETGDLVKWLKFQADQVNLELDNFSRGKVTNQEFLNEHSYDMQVVTQYHDLGKFFERVSGHNRLINIQNVRIQANTGQDRFNRSIRASFTAVTFVYHEKKETGQ